MAVSSRRFASVLFLVLISALAVFGQDVVNEEEYDNYDYSSNNDNNNNNNEEQEGNQETTTNTPRVTTTVSPEAAQEQRIADRITAKLNATFQARYSLLEFKMDRMKTELLSRIDGSSPGQRPSPPGSASGRPTSQPIFGRPDAVQTNTKMIQRLQDLVLSLQNKTENSQSYNETAASILDMSTQFQSELQGLGYRIDNLANDLKNQNLENLQIALGRLADLDQFRDEYKREKLEKKREKIVKDILDAFALSQNELVKDLLDDLTKDKVLNSSMPEIVGGMFAGNIRNYPRVIALFQSAKRRQYKLGVAALIDLFHRNNRTVAAGGNSNSGSRSLLEQPEYLELAYLAKSEFASEFQSKFPMLVQNLVFSKKVCLRNLLTNFYLSVDRDEGLKDGGYSVSTRRKSGAFTTAVLCDWEIVPPNGGSSFIIRRRNQGQAETLNLNVLEKAVFAGSSDYNPSYFWNIQLRKNAQELTIQSIAARSEDPSFFLCFAKGVNKAQRVSRREMDLSVQRGNTCAWFVEPSNTPQ